MFSTTTVLGDEMLVLCLQLVALPPSGQKSIIAGLKPQCVDVLCIYTIFNIILILYDFFFKTEAIPMKIVCKTCCLCLAFSL